MEERPAADAEEAENLLQEAVIDVSGQQIQGPLDGGLDGQHDDGPDKGPYSRTEGVSRVQDQGVVADPDDGQAADVGDQEQEDEN